LFLARIWQENTRGILTETTWRENTSWQPQDKMG